MSNGIPFFSANLNEKTRGKHANCPSCDSKMKRLYIKDQYCKQLKWVAVGWLCVKCGKAVLGDA